MGKVRSGELPSLDELKAANSGTDGELPSLDELKALKKKEPSAASVPSSAPSGSGIPFTLPKDQNDPLNPFGSPGTPEPQMTIGEAQKIADKFSGKVPEPKLSPVMLDKPKVKTEDDKMREFLTIQGGGDPEKTKDLLKAITKDPGGRYVNLSNDNKVAILTQVNGQEAANAEYDYGILEQRKIEAAEQGDIETIQAIEIEQGGLQQKAQQLFVDQKALFEKYPEEAKKILEQRKKYLDQQGIEKLYEEQKKEGGLPFVNAQFNEAKNWVSNATINAVGSSLVWINETVAKPTAEYLGAEGNTYATDFIHKVMDNALLPVVEKPIYNEKSGEWDLFRAVPQLAGQATTMALMVAGGKGLSKFGALSETAGVQVMGAAITFDDYLRQGIESGLDVKDGSAVAYAGITSAIQGLLEGIMPDSKIVFGSKEMAETFAKNFLKDKNLAVKSLLDMGRNIAGENAEEYSQLAANLLGNYATNAALGTDLEYKTSVQEVVNTAVLVTPTVLLMGAGNLVFNNSSESARQVAILSAQPTESLRIIEELSATGKFDPKNAEELKRQIQAAFDQRKKLPPELKGESVIEVIPLAVKREELLQENAEVIKPLKFINEDKIAVIDTEIQKIISKLEGLKVVENETKNPENKESKDSNSDTGTGVYDGKDKRSNSVDKLQADDNEVAPALKGEPKQVEEFLKREEIPAEEITKLSPEEIKGVQAEFDKQAKSGELEKPVKVAETIEPEPEVKQEKETAIETSPISISAEKYGWTAKENDKGETELFNRKGAKAVTVKQSGEKYIFLDAKGNRLLFGNKDIAAATEKLLKNFYSSQPATEKNPVAIPESNIQTWQAAFEKAKSDNDNAAVQELYNKVKVVTNGIAQSKGDATVKEFQALQKEIETYAESLKKPKTAEHTNTKQDVKKETDQKEGLLEPAKKEIQYHNQKGEKGENLHGATVTHKDQSVFIPLGAFNSTEIKVKAEKVLTELKDGTYRDGLSFEQMAGRKNLEWMRKSSEDTQSDISEETEKEAANEKAVSLGYNHSAHLVNSVNRRIKTYPGYKGETYEKVSDIPEAVLEKVSAERNKELSSAQEKVKPIVDKLKSLKVNTKGKAMDATLGIPTALWNYSIDIITTAIEAGASITDAITKGIEYLKSQNTEFEPDRYREYLNGELGNVEEVSAEVSDKEHADFIRNKFVEVFSGKGVPEQQLKAAVAVLDARAKVASPGNPDAYFKKITDVGTGDFQTDEVHFQFIGENSNLIEANEKLDKAKSLHSEKVDMEVIFRQTGWYIDKYDKKWKFELPQNNVRFLPEIEPKGYADVFSDNLGNILDYPELYRAYPEARNIKVEFVDGWEKTVFGSYENNKIKINANHDRTTQRETIRHEIQHYIQEREGFAKGASPHREGLQLVAERIILNRERIRDLNAILSTLPKNATSADYLKEELRKTEHLLSEIENNKIFWAEHLYKAHAGEIEAVNVQNRIEEEVRVKGSPLVTAPKYTESFITVKFQGEKGALETLNDGTFVIHALEQPDFSTAIHEIGHVFESELSLEQREVIKDFAGTKEWNTKTSETFATAFEKYLEEGVSPNSELKSIFEQAKEWLKEIYSALRNDVKLSPEVRKVFDELLGKDKPKSGLSGIKKALVPDDFIEATGIDRRSTEDMLKQGKELVESGQIDPEQLISEINLNAKALQPHEVAALVYYKVQLDNQFSAAYEAQAKARKEGDNEEISHQQAVLAGLDIKLQAYQLMQLKTAYEQSLAFRLRKMLLDAEYNLQDQISKYKAASPDGTIPPEVEARMKQYDTDLKAANEKLEQLEKEKIAWIEQQAVKNIEADIKGKTPKKEFKEKAHRIAEQIRKGKINRPGVFNSAIPGAQIWDIAIETAATTVDATGNLVQAISDGLTKIKNSDWYKKLDQKNKDEAEKQFTKFVSESGKKAEITYTDGKIKIPHTLIRDLVASGVNTIEDLTDEVHKRMLDEYPDVSKRQVRDAITGYGRTLNLNQEDLEKEIRRLKRVGKLISGLEDVRENMQRPQRSGLQRDKLTQQERLLQKELREEMKKLPEDAEMTAKAWKSSLDAIKARLQNQIDDLNKQIETKERTPKKLGVAYDQEALVLKEQRDKLKEVRDNLFGKPEISDEQRVKVAISAAERTLQDLNERIANRELERGKVKDKTPITAELAALRDQVKSTRKVLQQMQEQAGIPEKVRLETYKNRSRKQIAELQAKIANKDFSQKPKKPPVDFDGEARKLEAEKVRVKEAYETEHEKHLMSQRSRLRILWEDYIMEVFNLPKSLITTLDMSAPLRQGLVLILPRIFTHPFQTLKLFRGMFTFAFNETAYNNWLNELKASPEYTLIKQGGLHISEQHAKLAAREELFMSRLLHRKPLKYVVGISERSYVGFLNMLRVQVYLESAQTFMDMGISPRAYPEEYKALGNFVNNATGRGSLGKFEAAAVELSTIFFSPRLIAARFNILNPVRYASMPKHTRKLAIAKATQFLATAVAIASLLKLWADSDDDENTSFEIDPRSSDFGKYRLGNTRVDYSGGFLPWIRTSAQLITGEKKSTTSGNITQLGERFGSDTRLDVFVNFFRNKLGPVPSWIVKKAAPGPFDKEKTLQQEAVEFTVPLYLRDLKGIAEEHGALPAATLGILSFFGVGVQSYGETKPKKQEQKFIQK